MSRPTCFFCYAWGSERRYALLSCLRDEILKRSERQINVILDRKNYLDNQDFEQLRERIWKYDLIVLFCTPDLYNILNDIDSNSSKKREVSKEFRIIRDRYEYNANSVFPVVLEGTKESSLLDIFHNKNARVFEEFGDILKEKEKGRGYELNIPQKSQNDFGLFIGRIINTAIYNSQSKSDEYVTTREALDKLFSLTDTTNIPVECLVKPDLYSLIRNQSCCLVAGRKGSGKSTFIWNFTKMESGRAEKHYKHIIPLSAEAFDHENAYASMIVKLTKELPTLNPHAILCTFWEVYFFVQVILTIRTEIETYGIQKELDSRFYVFDKYTKQLKRKLGLQINRRRYKPINSDNVPRLVFELVVEMVANQIDYALGRIGEKENQLDSIIYTPVLSYINAQDIIEANFGKKETQSFLEALNQCDRKIMLSLDGFDTHSEDFRIVTETMSNIADEYRSRTEYERLFFRTLIEVVENFRKHKYADEILSVLENHTDFCVVLPKDRYDQIIQADRDSFKKQFGSMSWTAYELMELLTKRTEYLIGTITHTPVKVTTDDYFERFEKAIKFFPGLPTKIKMNVQGNIIQMSLFNYILRSSFWRPRDVISNLSSLLARVIRIDERDEWTVKTDVKLDESEVKLAIKDNATKILREECIGEYKYVFHNLQSVLNQFRGFNEQSTIFEFAKKLKEVRFETLYAYDMDLPENKLLVLYQMGIIGLHFKKTISDELHYLHPICFVFNAGMAPFEEFIEHDYLKERDVYILFNPIFARYLRLNFNTNELIGNWSQDYIRRNYIMKNMIKPL